MPDMVSITVIGAAVWLTELCKRRGMDKFFVPMVTFIAAGLVSCGWTLVFDSATPWREALQSGLFLGAVGGGLYGMGKVVIDKSTGGNGSSQSDTQPEAQNNTETKV